MMEEHTCLHGFDMDTARTQLGGRSYIPGV